MPLVRRSSHARDHVDDRVSTKFSGIIKETLPFNPPPPVHVPAKCGLFVVEESEFLLLFDRFGSPSGINDFHMVGNSSKFPGGTPPLSKAS